MIATQRSFLERLLTTVLCRALGTMICDAHLALSPNPSPSLSPCVPLWLQALCTAHSAYSPSRGWAYVLRKPSAASLHPQMMRHWSVCSPLLSLMGHTQPHALCFPKHSCQWAWNWTHRLHRLSLYITKKYTSFLHLKPPPCCNWTSFPGCKGDHIRPVYLTCCHRYLLFLYSHGVKNLTL